MDSSEARAAVEQILADLSRDLDDGVALKLEELSPSRLVAELVVEPDACEDCFVPNAMIADLILRRLVDSSVHVSSIEVTGPRVLSSEEVRG